MLKGRKSEKKQMKSAKKQMKRAKKQMTFSANEVAEMCGSEQQFAPFTYHVFVSHLCVFL